MNVTPETAARLQNLSAALRQVNDTDSLAAWERGYAASAADFAARMLFPGGDPEIIASYVADLIGQWLADRESGVGLATSRDPVEPAVSHSPR